MQRVLVIEDNERNLYLITFILERLGVAVVTARDGASGVARALEQPPDLIILDMQLPVLDGYAVAAKLREQPATRLVPILALTSLVMAGDREKCLAAGCTAYMEKPIDPEKFIVDIKKYLA